MKKTRARPALTRLITVIEHLTHLHDENYQLIVTAAANLYRIERQLDGIQSEMARIRRRVHPLPGSNPVLAALTLKPLTKKKTRAKNTR